MHVAGSASAVVVDCHVASGERVEVGDATTLVRLTLELRGASAQDLADARLLVSDGVRRHRHGALPAPLPQGADQVTLGFAIGRGATVLELELGERSLALPELSIRSLATPVARAPAAIADWLALEVLRSLSLELRGARGQAAAAQAAAAASARERDGALRAAAVAEAAAFDATAAIARVVRDQPVRVRRRRPSRTVVATCALGSTALAIAIAGWPSRDGARDVAVAGVASASSASTDRAAFVSGAPAIADPLSRRLQIPAEYLELYRAAGRRHGLDWTRLAAVGAIESRHGRARGAGVLAGANLRGASGPAQFLAATWERFGVDGDGDGARDPHDPADAIPAMAGYLRASGAPADWPAALRSYNHSDAYVAAVEQLAASYRRRLR